MKKYCVITPPETEKILSYMYGKKKVRTVWEAAEHFNLTDEYVKNILKDYVDSIKKGI